MGKNVLVIGDTHFPYTNFNSLTAIYSVIEKEKPDVVIQIGDLFDMYAFSSFPKSDDRLSAQEEMRQAREGAENMWKTIRKLVPKSQRYQLLGNHCIRAEKRAQELAPVLEFAVIRTLRDYFVFPGVSTIHDHREELIIDETAYIHGWSSRLGAHLNYMNGKYNLVHGHTHRAGISHKIFHTPYGPRMRWELDVGYIGDITSKVFHYTPQKHTNSTQAVGIIRDQVPEIILL